MVLWRSLEKIRKRTFQRCRMPQVWVSVAVVKRLTPFPFPIVSGTVPAWEMKATSQISLEFGFCFLFLNVSQPWKPATGVDPKEVLDWNSCLTIGCGEGVAAALRRTGCLAAQVWFAVGKIGTPAWVVEGIL